MSRLIVFDFDNTLFRTRQFWRERLFPAYEKEMGIDHVRMEEAFVRSTTGEVDYFLPRRFFEEVSNLVSPEDMERVKELFDRVVFSPESRNYFTDGTKEAIETLRAGGDLLMLVSYGDVAFKTAWFHSLGIIDWFAEGGMIPTPNKKSLLVKDLPEADETIYLDDSLGELLAFLEASQTAGRAARGVLYDPIQTQMPPVGILSLKELRLLPNVLAI